MRNKKYLLVIGGPTASGKTALAIALARKYTTEILSADSRQFFHEMSIGTAVPTADELAAVPHHFIRHLSIHTPYSVGDFERDALECLQRLFAQHDLVILVGGSGLYIQAVCSGLDHFPHVSETTRMAVATDYQEKGLTFLQSELAEKDPEYHRSVDLHNPHRLMRAISVVRESGKPFSHFLNQPKPERPFTPIYLALQHPRTVLYERINRRVDQMVELGLEAEAHALYPFRDNNALQTVGYQEWFDHFEARCSAEEAIASIKQHSRNFAKRQLTWMRREGFWKHFRQDETTGLLYAYLDRAIAESWQWSYDQAQGLLTLQSTSGPSGQVQLRFIGSGKKRITWMRPVFGEAGILSWLIHECVMRAEDTPLFADGVPEQAEVFRAAGLLPIAGDQPAGLPDLLPGSFRWMYPTDGR